MNYKVHLDGYNQMDLITAKGASNRHELYYFTGNTFSALRVDDFKYRLTDQPDGWFGYTIQYDNPLVTNLRLDPFERTTFIKGKDGSQSYWSWYNFELWRFQLAINELTDFSKTFVRFPPMKSSGGGDVDGRDPKAQIETVIKRFHPRQ